MARGIRIMQGYGLSETCPIIAVSQFKPAMTGWTPEAQFGVLERTGFPIPLVRAQVHDQAGQPLPVGQNHTGELVLRAPWLTPGYFKEVERSRELWRHGWLHTGDLAYVDADGFIRVTDRLKDVIKIGGEWISSLELEGILSQHDAVKEVAVVGVPDPKWDERPWALVVLRESQRGRVTARHLLAFLHKFIDSGVVHKRAVLTQIEFVDAIPRTSVGKVDKRLVRKLRAGSRPTSTA
jgi:fatty-acyl-CoA synthase